MQIYRARVFDTPTDPFAGGGLRSGSDVAIVVDSGRIVARTDFATARERHPYAEVVDLRAGVLLPGFVDTHVHFPQVRAIGHLGRPLLDWLDECALPEEAKLRDDAYAAGVATDFLTGLTDRKSVV